MPDLLALLLVPVFAIVAPHKDELSWWTMWKTPRHPMATRASPAGSCVPVAGHPLLRKAGLYGCIKPLRLGVMVMVATLREHGLTSESLWNNSSDLLDVELLEWPTPPCTVGDSERLGPRMRDQGAQGWMDSKAKSTWWCAQRGHLLGVQRLVKAVPDADFYLLADADTQGPPHIPATPRPRARVRTLPRLPPSALALALVLAPTLALLLTLAPTLALATTLALALALAPTLALSPALALSRP